MVSVHGQLPAWPGRPGGRGLCLTEKPDKAGGSGVTLRRAALHNLGCKVNAYETEAMEQLLEAAGYRIVSFQEAADVYVVNTCSVTNIAERKSRQMLHRARKLNPQAVIVAAGCYVQAAQEDLKKDLAVDIIIGNNKKQDLVPVLEDYFRQRERERSGGEALDRKSVV